MGGGHEKGELDAHTAALAAATEEFDSWVEDQKLRRVIVSRVGAAAGEQAGDDKVVRKVVHFVRHGEGEHNKAARLAALRGVRCECG